MEHDMAKLIRYRDHGGVECHGRIDGEQIIPLAGDLAEPRPIKGAAPIALRDVTLLAPVKPSKFIAVGPNYHAQLRGPPPARPYYWLKPSSALLDPGGTLMIPDFVPIACHESELAIVIGRETRKVSREQAATHILGYTCMNDATAGDLPSGLPFVQSLEFVDGKIFDTFAVLGPAIETELDPADLLVECRVNGETRQHHRTSDMIFHPHLLVSMISQFLTLYPGDVISSGSPPGVGKMSNGDEIEIEIEGIGILKHGVSGPN